MTETKWINIGIIGFGRIGAEHVGWIARTDNARVGAVFDPTPARRELAQSRGLHTVDSIEALLNDPSIEAVLIATPTAFHFDQAMQALSANKHLMIEKPLALDFAQAEKIVVEANLRRRVVSVFHNRRWDIDYLTVLSAVKSGVLGRIINVESRLGQWGSCVGPAAVEYRPNWRNEASYGGGGWFDWGSHFIDQLWRLMLPAKPVRLFAQLRGNVWSTDCDDFARVVIDFDNGAVGLVEINTTTRSPLPRWRLDGTLGTAQGPHSSSYNVLEWAKLELIPGDGSETKRIPLASAGLNEVQIWEQFSTAIMGTTIPAVPVETVLPTMKLLEWARQSNMEGRAVSCREIDPLLMRV